MVSFLVNHRGCAGNTVPTLSGVIYRAGVGRPAPQRRSDVVRPLSLTNLFERAGLTASMENRAAPVTDWWILTWRGDELDYRRCDLYGLPVPRLSRRTRPQRDLLGRADAFSRASSSRKDGSTPSCSYSKSRSRW